ncbi:SpoIIE family protein phosphatase [Prosthecobacter vanneervenii]|uniref:Serine phosphatase RsbU (Regulator of sigma subunit)/anti-sigma regulatory factor (Ser/Thr protein kinase) n=1 Tax=Prosthecobacter vanneervenii TaxID=48466 RepID=A0A7W8DJV0_9BACT|nr:SpoIIE family protein phosphatase [Prosthecobacter vanneervenii]MBB5032211.1 serine phosphatase RsbU (regulator of sigma subunit)/anti-sigma regulatory factor (Ser/Thr protein kinase) [Prosthecobacter vanneervenii]
MSHPQQQFNGFRLDFPATLDDAREAVRAVILWLANEKVSAEECQQWELVLAEAANNAVLYATPEQAGHSVRIEATLALDEVEIRITDHTCGFDWPEHVELPEDDESDHGRGLFIISSLTDQASYLRGQGQNVLLLKSKLKTPLPAKENTEETLDLMTAEVASCYETLANIFRLIADAGNDVEPVALATRWLEELRELAGADFLILRMASSDGLLMPLLGSAPSPLNWEAHLDLRSADYIESRAAKTRQDQWFDCGTDFMPADPLLKAGKHISGLTHPLESGGDLAGVLTVGVFQPHWEPSARELNVVRSLGDFLGALLHGLHRRDEANQARLMKRELQIAAEIQRSLLPTELPQSPFVHCAAHLATVGEVGGDYLDAILLADGSMLFVVADVMGKGVPAALFATAFHSLLHSHLDLASKPSALMNRLNQAMFSELDRADMFITAQLVHVTADGQWLQVCGAGHAPLLMSNGRQVQEVSADGPPLGVTADASYQDFSTSFSLHSHVLLHTDGLSDVVSGGGILSRDVLHEWLLKTAAGSTGAVDARDSLHRLHRSAVDASHQQDDATFLIITRVSHSHPSAAHNSLSHAKR